MAQTLAVPKSLFRKFEKASKAFRELEDELEDVLISQNDDLIERLSKAREEHLQGNLRPFDDI